jgi:hypothetical protein
LNTTGSLNVAVGTDALVHNDHGSANNAVGAFALFYNLVGDFNNAWATRRFFLIVLAIRTLPLVILRSTITT